MDNLFRDPKTYTALPAGFIFGANLQRSKMSNPTNIRNQMLMKQPNNMLKTFLSASASSAVVFSCIDLFDGPIILRTVGYNPWRQIVGGLLLGIGMNFGGACPGTIFAQLGGALGENVNSLKGVAATMLGGMVGAAVISSQQDLIQNFFGDFGPTWTLMDVTGVRSYWKLAIPFAVSLYGIVLGVTYAETVYNKLYPEPKSSELQIKDTKLHEPSIELRNKQSFQAAYIGMTSGVMLGLLQLPFYYFGNSYLGTSTFFVSIINPLLKNVYTDSRTIFKNAFQVLSNIGIVLGSYYIASSPLKPTSENSQSFSEDSPSGLNNITSTCSSQSIPRNTITYIVRKYSNAFISGLLLISGARLMEGCTSGHGLSGMAMLSIPSFVAVASMFAGGMISAQFEKYFK